MNILFIHSVDDILSPNKPLRTPEEMQFGISYISSVLKEHGHHTRLAVLSRMLGQRNKDIVDGYLKTFRPRLVLFTAVSTEYRFIADIAKYLKARYPETYLLVGGPHVSLNPDKVLMDGFDSLCIGEGEYPALELVTQMERGESPLSIPNLWIRKSSQIKKNPPRPLLQNLDSLPFPDREMWAEWIQEGVTAAYPVLLGRGCPFECTYCCNHALKRLAEGPYVRMRSPENILKEIEEIALRFPERREIYLEVETIGLDKRWALELCSKLEDLNSNLSEPLSFGVNLRISPSVDFESLFLAFEKSNFTRVNIGVESGSEKVRRNILNRHYSNQDIIDVVASARRHGLEIHFYNLIGVPGETASDFEETVEINRRCLPDKVYTHIFFPYPGTELYSKCKEQGLLKDQLDTELERCKATLDLPGFSKREIRKSFVWFDYYVYKGHRSMREILAKVLVSKCRSNPYIHYFYRRFTYSFLAKGLKILLKKMRLI